MTPDTGSPVLREKLPRVRQSTSTMRHKSKVRGTSINRWGLASTLRWKVKKTRTRWNSGNVHLEVYEIWSGHRRNDLKSQIVCRDKRCSISVRTLTSTHRTFTVHQKVNTCVIERQSHQESGLGHVHTTWVITVHPNNRFRPTTGTTPTSETPIRHVVNKHLVLSYTRKKTPD